MKAELDGGILRVMPENENEAVEIDNWVRTAFVMFNDQARGEYCYWRGSKVSVWLDCHNEPL